MRLALTVLLLVLVACGGTANSLPSADAAQDVPGLEVAVDASPEASADAPGPEAPPPVDAAVADDAAEAGPDAAPVDAPADVTAVGDAGPDALHVDAAADAPADVDPLEQRVTAVAVTVRSPSVEWTTARVQTCTVTGGAVSIGADFDRPERASFTSSGPTTGPVTLTYIAGTAVSDVRAMIRRGAEYSTDGGATRRTNLRVIGFMGGSYELTALGCVVR